MRRRGDGRDTPDAAGSWPRTRRLLAAAFLVAVAASLVVAGREVEWREVGAALRAYHPATLVVACATAIAAYLIYTSYDLLARRYTGHDIRWFHVMATAFVSYAFNLNLGAIIGAAGVRYRLYSRFGVRGGAINRIVGFSILTNWLGFLALGGAVLIAGDLDLPLAWTIRPGAPRLAGATMLLVVAWYVALCARARRRTIHVRGMEVVLCSGSHYL